MPAQLRELGLRRVRSRRTPFCPFSSRGLKSGALAAEQRAVMASLPRPLIALLVATVAAFASVVRRAQAELVLFGRARRASAATSRRSTRPIRPSRLRTPPTPGSARRPSTRSGRDLADQATRPRRPRPRPDRDQDRDHGQDHDHGQGRAGDHEDRRAKPAGAAKPAAKAPSVAQQVQLINSALDAAQGVAVLFYNDAAADDRRWLTSCARSRPTAARSSSSRFRSASSPASR